MHEGASALQQRAGEFPRAWSRLRRRAGSERGTALVEFALIAPLLFLVVFGIIEFGRILNAYNQLTQLAGQGARAAAVSRNPDGTAVGATSGTVDDTDCGAAMGHSIQCQLSKYYARQDSLSNVNVCIVNPTPGTPISVGSPVTVKTSYVYNFTVGLFGFTQMTLRTSQTERAEGNPTYDVGVDQNGNACS
jgi:Flp pilus assembly protein TadG